MGILDAAQRKSLWGRLPCDPGARLTDRGLRVCGACDAPPLCRLPCAGSTGPALQLSSHKSWVPAVKWCVGLPLRVLPRLHWPEPERAYVVHALAVLQSASLWAGLSPVRLRVMAVQLLAHACALLLQVSQQQPASPPPLGLLRRNGQGLGHQEHSKSAPLCGCDLPDTVNRPLWIRWILIICPGQGSEFRILPPQLPCRSPSTLLRLTQRTR